MTPSMNRRAVFAAACLGLLVFGIVLTLLGAVLPGVITHFGIGKAEAGALFMLLTLGILAGSLVFGPVADRYGYKGMLAGALLLVSIGLEVIAFAPSLALLRTGLLVIGFGGGILNGGTNALVADISEEGKSAWLSMLAIFFGVGAVGVPFSIGMLLDHASFAAIVGGMGALVLLPLVYTLAIPFPGAKQSEGVSLAAVKGLLRDPVLLLFGTMLFLESGMEIAVGGWTATFFNEELGLAAERAATVLALYWLGMMLVRLVLGSVLRRVAPARALLVCIGLAIIGSLVMVSSASIAGAAAGTFFLGAGFAAAYPVVLGFVGERHPQLSGTAFSIVLVMALVGGMLFPWAIGVLGATQGLRSSFLLVPAALVLQAALLAVVTRRLAAAPAAG